MRNNVKVMKPKKRKHYVLRWIDPKTDRPRQRTTGTNRRREALAMAARLKVELEDGVDSPNETLWVVFCERYMAEHLVHLKRKTRANWRTAKSAIERFSTPIYIQQVDASFLSRLSAFLFAEGLTPSSVKTYFGYLKPALKWAARVGIIRIAPAFPKLPKVHKYMRGRPLTENEFERMLEAVPKVRKHDADQWEYYLKSLWWSGLRCEESTILSWQIDSEFRPDLTGEYPVFYISHVADKGNRDRFFPIAPEFADMLERVSADDRAGPVIAPRTVGGRVFSIKAISRIVSDIGSKAGVLIDRQAEKFATAHDLRRSFGTRWARKVVPAALQKLMRHSSIETTMKYYVDIEAQSLCGDIWKAAGRPHRKPKK